MRQQPTSPFCPPQSHPTLVDTSSERQSHISMDEKFGDDTVTRAQGVVVFDFGKGSGWEITRISVVINLRRSKTTYQLSHFHHCHTYNLELSIVSQKTQLFNRLLSIFPTVDQKKCIQHLDLLLPIFINWPILVTIWNI